MRHPRAVPIVLVLVLSAGCASTNALHRTALASEQLAVSAQRLQAVEIDLYRAGQVTAPQHVQWQTGFLRLGQAIQGLNGALKVGNAPDANRQVRAALDILDTFLAYVPQLDATTRGLVASAIESIRTLLVLLGSAEV